jgi:peptide/nickel transport system substrate-binding protein
MTRSRSRWRSVTLLLVATALIGEACGEPTPSTASSQPSSPQSVTAAPSTGPFEPMAWPPPGGGAPCDQPAAPDADHAPYTGLIRRIRSIDAETIEFRLCAPDVGFPTRLAFAAFGINDTAWLETHIDPGRGGEQAIVSEVNGTGPYRLERWNRGADVSLVRNDAYWGATARNERVIVRWRDNAADRLAELRGASVDGVDDIGPGGLEAIEGDVAMQAVPRAGLNTFYVGFNNTFAPFDNPKVRQAIAMGLDREHLVAALFPPGSEVASHFSSCAIPLGCTGDPWYEFDPSAARQLLATAGFADGFETTIQYRDVARAYLPDPTAVATALQEQLLANLNIRAELEVLPEATFLDTVDNGGADGIHLLGRVASIPEVSNLLDPHFGAGASREFGAPIDAIVDALTAGAATIDEAARTTAYTDANIAIRSTVPMIPIAHLGSLTGYRADVVGAVASSLRYERFAMMTPGDRTQLVWLTADAPRGLYCADETDAVAQLVCSQLVEGLYAFAPDTAAVVPALATGCEPNPELTTWRCTLRPGLIFHDGSALDANDVVLSFVVQWDADHPLHRGREGAFQPFVDTFGGLLNPPDTGQVP